MNSEPAPALAKTPAKKPLQPGMVLQLDGIWFRIHKRTKKDLVLRRLSEEMIKRLKYRVEADKVKKAETDAEKEERCI